MALVSPMLKLGTQGLPPPTLSLSQVIQPARVHQALRISYLCRCQGAGLPCRVLTARREAGTFPPAFQGKVYETPLAQSQDSPIPGQQAHLHFMCWFRGSPVTRGSLSVAIGLETGGGG